MSHTFQTSSKTSFACKSDYSGPIQIASSLEGNQGPLPCVTNVNIEDLEIFLAIKVEKEINSMVESTDLNLQDLYNIKGFIETILKEK